MVDGSGGPGARGAGRPPPCNDGTAGRPTWPDVGRVLEAGLARTSSARGRESLERVAQAVAALRIARERITFAAVGAWCVERFDGPTFQSIQNNERLGDVVRVAAEVQACETRPPTGRPLEDEILDCVSGNVDLRSRTEALLADRRAVIFEKDQLRAAFRRVSAMAFLSKEMAEAGVATLEAMIERIRSVKAPPPGQDFTNDEREACRDFLSSGMAALGYSVDEPSGEIIDRSQRTVAGPGVASVLRKAAGMAMLERAAKPTDVPARARKPR